MRYLMSYYKLFTKFCKNCKILRYNFFTMLYFKNELANLKVYTLNFVSFFIFLCFLLLFLYYFFLVFLLYFLQDFTYPLYWAKMYEYYYFIFLFVFHHHCSLLFFLLSLIFFSLSCLFSYFSLFFDFFLLFLY